MAASDQLKQLLGRYADGLATGQEEEQLFSLVEQANDEDLQSALVAMLSATRPQYDEARRQRALNKLLSHINENEKARVIPMRRRWIKWVAAALIVGVLATAAITVISKRSEKSPATTIAQTHDVPAPKETRAVITLADGSKVYLDSVGNGTIAQESNVKVVKNEKGEIVYLSPAGGGGAKAPGVDYNTAYNPRGSKVLPLTLTDGTKVWLNAESSLKYPTAFTGSTREVEITGEAYFEVVHNGKQPFKVHLPNGSVVEDIGTAFNVNAYADEEAIKTTLIEGSVKLSPAGGGDLNESSNNKRPGVDKGVVLKPGQQAVMSSFNLQHLTFNSPDLDEVLAWKNGLFSFEDARIETVMKQIARWYDVDVIYQDRPTKIFRGSIPRDMSAAKVFAALEETGGVHFKIEGKKIIVMN